MRSSSAASTRWPTAAPVRRTTGRLGPTATRPRPPAWTRYWPAADFAIAPTNAPAWPIEYGTEDDYRVLTSSLCAVTGSPSVSLPAGSVDGLPLGISLLGRRGQDTELLAFAAAVQRLLPAASYPPD